MDVHKKPLHPFAAQHIFPYNQRTQVRVSPQAKQCTEMRVDEVPYVQ